MSSPGYSAGLPLLQTREIIRRALAEDLPWGDITSEMLVPAETLASGRFVVREDGIICGLAVAALVFEQLDPSIVFSSCAVDGDRVMAGATVATLNGPARAILSGERTALNLLQRMSGIATTTARYVAAAGSGVSVTDTRKTAPGLRLLDKYAVRCGGGSNHRFSLSDSVLVKDNHLAAITTEGGGWPETQGDTQRDTQGVPVPTATMVERLRTLRKQAPHTVKIEVEVDRLDQIEAALAGGADIILLDNMAPATLRQAVDSIAGRALTEASGGITLGSIRQVAASGVNLISVGSLTHSVRALDIGLEL